MSFLRNFIHQDLPSIKNQQDSIYHGVPSQSPDTSSPILVIAILGIIITAFLLLSYYVFVIKCWLNLHRIGLSRRFFTSQTQRYEDPLIAYDPTTVNRGVDEAVIREIPVFQFKRVGERLVEKERNLYECAVCLNEFQNEEKLRVLPSCTHAFHIDCIDIWLQNNANCPLCRTSISTTKRLPSDQIIAPSTSPQDQSSVIGTPISGEEDFVVIEVNSDQIIDTKIGETIRIRSLDHGKGKKFQRVSSMGDECIDVRCKDDQFSVQPIKRRSFSMDSSTDRQLYLAVQEIIQRNRHINEVSRNDASTSRDCRTIFSFRHGQASKNAVIPIGLRHHLL